MANRNSTNFGLDFLGFDELIQQVEQMGEDTEEIAKNVVNAGIAAALPRFRANVPVGDGVNPQGRARDNVAASGVKKSKNGTKYRLISFRGDRGYLYMLDRGTSKMPAHPWLNKAQKEAKAAAESAMVEQLKAEIQAKLEGKEPPTPPSVPTDSSIGNKTLKKIKKQRKRIKQNRSRKTTSKGKSTSLSSTFSQIKRAYKKGQKIAKRISKIPKF